MPEYNIGFSEKLIEAAQVVLSNSANTIDSQRTVLYLSLLSCEITLKSLLENAGIPIEEIKHCSHKLTSLVDKVCLCEVQEELVVGQSIWVSASRICAITIDLDSGSSTVGTLLTLEQEGASQYPNEIRYGSDIAHAPAAAMLQTAEKIFEWVTKHLGKVRQNTVEKSKPKKAANGGLKKRETLVAATNFCSVYGGGIKVGNELKFNAAERDQRGQDYWIGYTVIDSAGKKCGEITAGYIAYIGDFRLYAEITIDGDTITSDASELTAISSHNKQKNEQPKELKALIINMTERAIRKIKSKRGA